MDFMKRHKIKLVLLGVFILVFIASLIALVSMLYPDSKKDVYGNRLEGIKDVKISNQVITEIKDKILSSDFVDDTDYVLKGKLITFKLEVKADTKVTSAKKLVSNITECLSEKIQAFYDIQVIIIEDKEESTNYPVFAYKHKTSKNFVWTNN